MTYELGRALTPRETEVMEEVARGRTNGEIAKDLGMSLQTVKAHMNMIFRKIGVRNRVEAVLHHRGVQ